MMNKIASLAKRALAWLFEKPNVPVPFYKRRWFSAGVGLLLVVALIVPTKSGGGAPAPTHSKTPIESAAPAARPLKIAPKKTETPEPVIGPVSVEEIVGMYVEAASDAEEQFTGRLVRVSGKLEDVSLRYGHQEEVTLTTEEDSLYLVTCVTNMAGEKRGQEIGIGHPVSVEGRARFEHSILWLEDCEVL